MPSVHGHEVRGVDVDPETRCRHYGSDVDVIAIRFPCCETFYPCFECHEAVADHEAEQWGADDPDAPAVLCGVCGEVLTVQEYVDCEDRCPECDAAFNPGCRTHYHYYFDDAPAVLCGVCGEVLTVQEYVDCEDRCPDCRTGFNPGCRTHYHLYFVDALFEE